MKRELIIGLVVGVALGVVVCLLLTSDGGKELHHPSWPCVDCSTAKYPNQEAVDHIAAILHNASTDLASLDPKDANYTQKRNDLAETLELANKCLAGTHPPVNRPLMTLARHCKYLTDARTLSAGPFNATKWYNVKQELGHGH